MSLEQTIFDACRHRESVYFYVGENIPERKLQNALAEFPVSANETIFALVDTTVFGSAKQGALFTNLGIYAINSWTGQMPKGFISWDDFQYAEFDHTNRFTQKEVWIDNLQIEMSGSSLTPPVLEQTLVFIQQCIQRYHANSHQQSYSTAEPAATKKPVAPPPPTQEAWMVAIDGEQYGPYDQQTIIEMIQTNRVNGNKDYLWKQGMENWALIKDCAPFNTYLAPTPPLLVATPPVEELNATDETYNQIDVNQATISDFLSLPHFSLENTNALLLKRNALGGSFKSIEEVQDVLALDPHEFEQIRPYLKIGPLQKASTRTGGRVIDY